MQCQNGGECNAGVCDCVAEYTGVTCESHLCDIYDCQNGGTCSVNDGEATCTCTNDYSGSQCEANKCNVSLLW